MHFKELSRMLQDGAMWEAKEQCAFSFLNNVSKLTWAYQRQARQLSEALIKNANRMNQAMGQTMPQDFRAQEPSPFI